eukprot:499682-Pyramimonas_sp.AAC.1
MKCGYILTTDQSDAENVGMFSRRTNRRFKSPSENSFLFERNESLEHSVTRAAHQKENQQKKPEKSRVYSYHGPIGHMKCGYILTTDQSARDRLPARRVPSTAWPPPAAP